MVRELYNDEEEYLNEKYKHTGETFKTELRARKCLLKNPGARLYRIMNYYSYDIFVAHGRTSIREGAVPYVKRWLVTKSVNPTKKG